MNILGTKTKNAAIYKHESHKLHQAFSAADEVKDLIYAGNPVALQTDGTIENFTGANGIYLGIATTPGAANMYPPSSLGKEVTVAVQGYMIVRGIASAEITEAGYVKPVDNHATEPYFTYAPSELNAETQFIALHPAVEGDLVEILIR